MCNVHMCICLFTCVWRLRMMSRLTCNLYLTYWGRVSLKWACCCSLLWGFHFCFPRPRITGGLPHPPGPFVGFGNQNSGPHVYVGNALYLLSRLFSPIFKKMIFFLKNNLLFSQYKIVHVFRVLCDSSVNIQWSYMVVGIYVFLNINFCTYFLKRY